MNPFPGPRSVLVMDNCPIHRGQRLRDVAAAANIRLEFLSPYSPDFNPVSCPLIFIFFLLVSPCRIHLNFLTDRTGILPHEELPPSPP